MCFALCLFAHKKFQISRNVIFLLLLLLSLLLLLLLPIYCLRTQHDRQRRSSLDECDEAAWMKTEKQRRHCRCCGYCCWQSLLGGWASLALSRSLTGLSAAAAAMLRPAFAAAARVVLALAHILCVHILQHCCQLAMVGGGGVWGLLFSLCVLFFVLLGLRCHWTPCVWLLPASRLSQFGVGTCSKRG